MDWPLNLTLSGMVLKKRMPNQKGGFLRPLLNLNVQMIRSEGRLSKGENDAAIAENDATAAENDATTA